MLKNNKISAIILAGGKSRRMGRDKKMLQITDSGEMLWQRTVSLVEPLANEILIIARSDEIQHPKRPVIQDIIPGLGPLGGIYTGLQNITSPLALVLPIDMPLLDRQTLGKLLNRATANDKIIIARHGEYIEPLVGLYPRDALPHIESMIKQKTYKLRLLYELYPTCFVDFTDHTPFLNINTPGDLEKLQKILQQPRQ